MTLEAAFVMKAGDNAPPLEMLLVDGAGVVVDLLGALIELHVRKTSDMTGLLLTGVVGNADGVTGLVRYLWPTPYPLVPGVYAGEWRVTWTNDGMILSFPNDGYFLLEIVSSLI